MHAQPALPDISIPAEAEERVVPLEEVQRVGRLPVKRRPGAAANDARQPLLAADGGASDGAGTETAEAV
jgi:hypothetical protein